MQVLWIKRDIRLEQNYAFVRACEGVKQYGPVVPLFVHEPSLWSRPEYSLRHHCFVKECLTSYAKRLSSCGGELLQATGEVIDVLADIHQQYGVRRIVAHQEVTDSPGYARDNAVRRWAKSNSIEILEVEQNNVLRGQGEKLPFSEWFAFAMQAKVRNPVGKDLSAFFTKRVSTKYAQALLPNVGGTDCTHRQRGGREEAERLMRRFFNPETLLAYPSRLSSPIHSVEGCSRLSPYLAWGVISHAEVAKAVGESVSHALQTNHPKSKRLENAARFYLDRLRWRMGYHAHCEVHTDTDTTDYFAGFGKPVSPDFEWSQGYAARLCAMREAKTGIPYIDACLRQLMATGYLAFRARSTLANFLCMGLGLHWRDVGEHLASLFLDFDGGSIHWSQMRIASGTGIFNSMLVYSVAKQARDFDADCAWQKQWCPELQLLPANLIHDIWDKPESTLAEYGVRLGFDYPRAICNPELAMREGKKYVAHIRHKDRNSL